MASAPGSALADGVGEGLSEGVATTDVTGTVDPTKRAVGAAGALKEASEGCGAGGDQSTLIR